METPTFSGEASKCRLVCGFLNISIVLIIEELPLYQKSKNKSKCLSHWNVILFGEKYHVSIMLVSRLNLSPLFSSSLNKERVCSPFDPSSLFLLLGITASMKTHALWIQITPNPSIRGVECPTISKEP